MNKLKYIEIKKRKGIKKIEKRNTTANEVIFIFEKVLEDWKTIKIYNTIIQNNPRSSILKKNVENISTGNCKVYENELEKDRYDYYLNLREKVYKYNFSKK